MNIEPGGKIPIAVNRLFTLGAGLSIVNGVLTVIGGGGGSGVDLEGGSAGSNNNNEYVVDVDGGPA